MKTWFTGTPKQFLKNINKLPRSRADEVLTVSIFTP